VPWSPEDTAQAATTAAVSRPAVESTIFRLDPFAGSGAVVAN
jgi:hypothetical protein